MSTDPNAVGPFGFSDAGRRCSDTVRQAIVDGHAGRWVAVRLSDGGTDGRVYDSRRDAIRYQLHENLCAYVKVPRDDMPPREATDFLRVNRTLYDAGMRIADPDGPDLEVRAPAFLTDLHAAVRDLERQVGLS